MLSRRPASCEPAGTVSEGWPNRGRSPAAETHPRRPSPETHLRHIPARLPSQRAPARPAQAIARRGSPRTRTSGTRRLPTWLCFQGPRPGRGFLPES